jgi:hypothetical protein
VVNTVKYPEFATKKPPKKQFKHHNPTPGINFFSKSSLRFRTSEHQESTVPEKLSTGPEYLNGGNKIC